VVLSPPPLFIPDDPPSPWNDLTAILHSWETSVLSPLSAGTSPALSLTSLPRGSVDPDSNSPDPSSPHLTQALPAPLSAPLSNPPSTVPLLPLSETFSSASSSTFPDIANHTQWVKKVRQVAKQHSLQNADSSNTLALRIVGSNIEDAAEALVLHIKACLTGATVQLPANYGNTTVQYFNVDKLLWGTRSWFVYVFFSFLRELI
jgi:hypothetical protein